jgi:ATP-dependent DNA helicase PIF1
MAEMDIGKNIFTYGQTYVALSRIRSLDGLYLSGFDPSRVKANPKVKEFYDRIPTTLDNNEKDTNIKIIKL